MGKLCSVLLPSLVLGYSIVINNSFVVVLLYYIIKTAFIIEFFLIKNGLNFLFINDFCIKRQF